MTYVECAGGQDRDTTTSETRPYIPPNKTRNCYVKDKFDRDDCGTSSDSACQGNKMENGGLMEMINSDSESCKPGDQGGYCKVGDKYYVARNDVFIELNSEDLLDRYKSSSSSSNEVDTKRALNDQERRFTNRIRELQIKGQDPLNKKNSEKEDKEDNELHSSISGMLSRIGMWFLVILFFISLSILLVQKKYI
tara:strand:- start:314 stop:895 length:582 start_codon:yes stop_codon:yes gene_type:complete